MMPVVALAMARMALSMAMMPTPCTPAIKLKSLTNELSMLPSGRLSYTHGSSRFGTSVARRSQSSLEALTDAAATIGVWIAGACTRLAMKTYYSALLPISHRLEDAVDEHRGVVRGALGIGLIVLVLDEKHEGLGLGDRARIHFSRAVKNILCPL